MTSNELKSSELPIRKSPPNLHSKLFQGCVSLSGLKRSFSLSRQSCLNFKHSTPSCYSAAQPKNFRNLFNQEFNCKTKSNNRNFVDYAISEFPTCSRGHDNLVFENIDLELGEHSNVDVAAESGSTETKLSEFYDPLLAELDLDLPVPPVPPPRACPHWLKCALRKQTSPNPMFDLPSNLLPLFTSTLAPTDKINHQKSRSLEHSRFNLRIHPVIQNGVKISDTHYWLLDPPKPKHLNLSESSTNCDANEEGYLNVGTLNTCPVNEIDSAKELKHERDLLNNSIESLHCVHKNLVFNLMKKVPMATESECQAVLIGTNYDYDQAVKRLKLELLCRKGYLTRSHNKRILSKCEWDLEIALSHAFAEFEYRKLHRDEKLARQHSKNKPKKSPPNLKLNFSASSSSSTSSLSVH